MEKWKISPSIMCADFLRLKESIMALEKAGVDYLHVDIMDGSFVPNFTLGPDFVSALRAATRLPMDLHLMIWEPGKHFGSFHPQPGDLVTIHQEASVHLQRDLHQIRECGAKAGVALNPATSIHTLEHILDDLDVVLVMTVNPGFAGQKLIPSTLTKIERLRSYLDESGYGQIEIEVDGNVSFENAKKMKNAGANLFVAGTSSIFKENEDLYALTREFRMCIAS